MGLRDYSQLFSVRDLRNIVFGTIVIVGGLGSMTGALAGGVLIGVSEAMAGFFLAPSAKSMFSFALLILVLLFRPSGLLGARS